MASVLAQRAVDVRVLIIDDCSPDETPLVAQRLAERDTRVEYRRHAENWGPFATYDDGLDWAVHDSDYTALVSADDQLIPDSLHRATAVMEASPNVGMVYGWALYARSGRPLPTRHGRWLGTKIWEGEDWIRLRCRSGTNCISSPEVVVRTEVQRAVGHYDATCTHCADLNMWLKIAAIADIAHIRGVAQAIYRIHADSMLRSNPSVLLSLRTRWAAFDRFFEHSAPRSPKAEELRATAARALARQALWRASRTIDRDLVDPLDSVDDLIAFALEVCPDATRLAEWRGLQVRRRIGAGRSRWFPPFLATGAAHRAEQHLGRLKLKTLGT